jgi:hypothetical protein
LCGKDLRTLRVRILVPNRKRTLEVNVTGRTISRTEAAFKARQDSEERLIIALVLIQEGRPAAGDGRTCRCLLILRGAQRT